MPVLDGRWRSSSIAASNPPAEPPMPTIGQLEFCWLIAKRTLSWMTSIATILCQLVLIRDANALDIALPFAAMRRRSWYPCLRVIQQVN